MFYLKILFYFDCHILSHLELYLIIEGDECLRFYPWFDIDDNDDILYCVLNYGERYTANASSFSEVILIYWHVCARISRVPIGGVAGTPDERRVAKRRLGSPRWIRRDARFTSRVCVEEASGPIPLFTWVHHVLSWAMGLRRDHSGGETFMCLTMLFVDDRRDFIIVMSMPGMR